MINIIIKKDKNQPGLPPKIKDWPKLKKMLANKKFLSYI